MRSFFLIILAVLAQFSMSGQAADTLALAGEWRFALDRDDSGIPEKWFVRNLPDKIQLPGVLEAQGYGDEISVHTPWVLSLYDHFWYLRQAYAAYTNAGNVQVPFLCQPPRHYLGAAWYQRDVEIPEDWRGKRIVLFLERPHWKSTVWLDGREIGSDISLCTPHEFDFGLVPPGRHRLAIRVDNRMILPYRPDSHGVSDSLDNAWNGIIGKMQLRATSPVWIDDVDIFPDAKTRIIKARMNLHNASGLEASGKIEFYVESCLGTKPIAVVPSSENFNNFSDTNAPVEAEIALGSQAELWDEFSPALYRLRVEVRSRTEKFNFDEETTNCFGLRDFHTDGNQFILNGRQIFLRGTHFGGDFPLTGYPPTDTASWRKMFQTCKDYGLNHMRFHSCCPPEAALTAADELGFYLQVEPGMWNAFAPDSEITKQLYAETGRIIKAYGNHPSLMLVSASNEAAGRWKQVLPGWVKHFREADPRHLYTPDTGRSLIDSPDEPLNGGADYLAISRIGPNQVRGERGWFGGDYQNSIEGVKVPVVAHEVGQWCAYPDFEVIRKFTGFMRPGNYDIFRDSAAAHGVLEMNNEFAHASGKFQLECYKEEIEANLRTPGLAGFQLLDLHDYTGQGTALVGLLDPFWESKGCVTPGEFKKFCNTVVPLARLKQRVFRTTEKFEVPVEVANYGGEAITNAQMSWAIIDASGKIVFQDAAAPRNLPIGKGLGFGSVSADLSKLPAPAKYKLAVTIGPQPLNSFGRLPPFFENDWNFWLYPAPVEDSRATDVFQTSSWREAEKVLLAGGKVFFTPHPADLSWWSPPLASVPVFWNALMGPTWSRMLGLWCDTNSPALAEFPTDDYCDWQWTEIVRHARTVNLDKIPRGLKPIVSAIDDWNRNYKLGVIFEARMGRGKLLVCTADLNTAPVGWQLRRSLMDYMAGDEFHPATEITPAEFESLFFDNLVMRKLGATATADGKAVNEILDGDPDTFWCSADAHGKGPNPPHDIVVSFPRPVAMNGLVLMPRQNQREHQGDIREYRLAAGDDGTHWETIASGQLASTFDPQMIAFAQTITAKKLKLTALSGFGTDTAAAVAELAVIYSGPALPENGDHPMEYRRIRSASPEIDAGDASVDPARH